MKIVKRNCCNSNSNNRKRPSFMCIFNDGPFSFLERFLHIYFFFWKYYNIFNKQSNKRNNIAIWYIVFVLFHSLTIILTVSFSVSFNFVGSLFNFCIFYIITSRWSCIFFTHHFAMFWIGIYMHFERKSACDFFSLSISVSNVVILSHFQWTNISCVYVYM